MVIWKNPQQTLTQWGSGPGQTLQGEPQSLLIWNVYKGQKGLGFAQDLNRLSVGKNFLLLQETILQNQAPPSWKQPLEHFVWNVAQSFEYRYKNMATGVAIASLTAPVEVDFLRAGARELFWLTPKISLFAEYDFQGRKVLFVSSHVLNFVSTSVFIRSLEEIAEKISRFQGPVVLAGDFNTWNLKRMLAMKAVFRQLGLEHVEVEDDQRFLKLDHLFVRGLDVLGLEILHSVVSSDHYPLEAKIVLKP